MKLHFLSIFSFPFTTLAFISKRLSNHAVPLRSSNALLKAEHCVYSWRCWPITTCFHFSLYEDQLKFIIASCFFVRCISSHVVSDPDWFKSLPCTGKASGLFCYINLSDKLASQKNQNGKQKEYVFDQIVLFLKMPFEVVIFYFFF